MNSDVSNLTIGADLSYRLTDGIKVYGAIFFDDLQKFSPGAFSNQVGLQSGGHWVDPLGLKDVDVRAEFVHLEPYTYAHNFDINAYTHFRSVLGHPLGPNADRLFLRAGWLVNQSVHLGIQGTRTREGDNYDADGELINVGGNASLGRRPNDVAERSFLAGDRTNSSDLELSIGIVPVTSLRFGFSYRRSRTQITRALTGGLPAETQNVFSFTTELNAF